MKKLALFLLSLLVAPACHAQTTWAFGTVTSDGATMGATAGAVQFRINACNTGWTEQTSMADKTILVTTAAAMDAGTTGGSNTITPAGTNSTVNFTPAGTNGTVNFTPAGTNGTVTGPAQVISWPGGVPTHSGTTATFSGSALGTHSHELPFQIPTTTTTRQIAVATFGTGTSRAATAVSATGTANTTSAAVALTQATSAGTPAGTVNITSQGTIAWPAGVPTNATSTIPAETFTGTQGTVPAEAFTGTQGTVPAQTFTGTSFDNRSAWVKLIMCVKD